MSASRLRLNPAKTQSGSILDSSCRRLTCDSLTPHGISESRSIVNFRWRHTFLPSVDLNINYSNSAQLSNQCRRRPPKCQSMHSSHPARKYCNPLLYGITDGLRQKLQSVQSAAAILVTGARTRDHITPMLHKLHWLTVGQRFAFKIACLDFQSQSRQATEYLINDCRLVTGSRR